MLDRMALVVHMASCHAAACATWQHDRTVRRSQLYRGTL